MRIEATAARGIVKIIEREVRIKGKKILDVGSGWGGLVVFGSLQGAKTFGVEPREESVKISKLHTKVYKCKECCFIRAVGENLPFIDSSFDIVTCMAVLEHVKSPSKTIEEIIRVTKDKGFCFIHCPNYLYPYEAHYKIFWIPLMPKSLAKIYLKLRGRKPSFIEHINYTTHPLLFKILKQFRVGVRNLEEENIKEKIGNVESIYSQKWRLLLKVSNSFHLTFVLLKIYVLLFGEIFYMIKNYKSSHGNP